MSNYVNIENEIELSYVEKQYPAQNTGMHYHNAYEIYIFEKGNRNYVIGNTLVELSERDVVLIKPHLLHATDGGSFKRYLINFKKEYLDTFFTETASEKLLSCFEYEKIHLSQTKYEQVITLIKNLMADENDFVSFCKMLEIFSSSVRDNVTEQISPQNVLISNIVNYIGRNYREIETLEEIANRFFITKSYLCRLFKKNTGISVIRYVNTLKIRYACRLLSETDKTSGEIASLSGFNTSMYFCKTFKQISGMTPSDYRKSYKL